MPFRLTQTEKFKSPVEVMIANEKGGFDESTFTGIFKRPSASELNDIFKSLPSDVELIKKYLVGWEMTDADSNESVPFNTENLAALLEITTAAPAIAKAFVDTAQGARAKNSK